MAVSLTRRKVLRAGIHLLGAGSLLVGSPSRAEVVEPLRLSGDQRRMLLAALERENGRYDAEVKMIRTGASDIGYHTTISTGYVHPTRNSLQYASGLLDAGGEKNLQRAQDILEKVVPLQDTDPASRTYGIWSWYLEEPLDEMSPPDWNWADFCGVQLLSIWMHHRNRLGAELELQVREAIDHAAKSIQRRNVGPSYTNIAIMGTYVSLVTAERFGLANLQEYAKNRLRRLHKYVLDQGSFTEYNSPTYTIVAIAELSRMLMNVRDAGDRQLVSEIHDLAWKHVATHFHVPTHQWAGPHSRCYATDLRRRKSTLAFIEAATGRQTKLIDEDPLPINLDYCRLALNCPSKYISFFKVLPEARQVVETFSHKGRADEVIGTTYLNPKYTLGTANYADFWRQRRPFLAYWGTPEKPEYLQVRFLHDGYDFCSAIPLTAQAEGRALSVVVFATDYGDTHVSLDRIKNATIRANDLRLRFEIGAETGGVKIEKKDNGFVIGNRGIAIVLVPMKSKFGDEPVHWETGRDENRLWIDAVCYAGEERAIAFNSLKEAYLAYAMEIREIEGSTIPEPDFRPRLNGNEFSCNWSRPKKAIESHPPDSLTMKINFSKKPAQRREIIETFRRIITHTGG